MTLKSNSQQKTTVNIKDEKKADKGVEGLNLPVLTAQTTWLPQNRPIASNDLGDTANMMGYLD